MQPINLILGGLMLALIACAPRQRDEEPQLTPEQRAAEARQSAATGATEGRRRFEASKLDYITRSENTVAGLEAKIAAFRAAAPADPAAREAYMADVAALEENLATAKAELEDVRGASIESWEGEQRQLEQALLTTRAAYDAAVAAH